MSVYDDALEAIKDGQSVVINGVQYTLENVQDLPKLEEIVGDDEDAKTEAYEALKAEKEALEKRLKNLEAKEVKPKVEKEK